MSEGRPAARDVLLGLLKTCRKLGVSFYRYLGHRLRVPGATPVPRYRPRPSGQRNSLTGGARHRVSSLTGVSTNGVVHTGLREGHDRDYACVVVEDCCAGASDEEHRNAISCMRRFGPIQLSSEVNFSAP